VTLDADDRSTLARRGDARVTGRAAAPWVLLIAALAGMAVFSQGLRTVDTIGLLICGAVAGMSLAEIAARRGRR
jgi:hypothetical protein